MKKAVRVTFLLLGFILTALPTAMDIRAQEPPSKPRELAVSSWLAAGPFPSPLPAFGDSRSRRSGLGDLLSFEPWTIPELRPRIGNAPGGQAGLSFSWQVVSSGEKGAELTVKEGMPQTAYLAAYLEVRRWTPAKVTFRSRHLFQAYLDGKIIATKSKADKNDKDVGPGEGRFSADLKLETGQHLLMVKTIYDPAAGSPWSLGAGLEIPERIGPETVRVVTEPEDRMTLKRLLDGPKAAAVSISPDGSTAALSLRQTLPPTDDSETWVEITNVSDGRLLQTLRCGGWSGVVQWTGDGRKLSYTTQDKTGGSIWLADLSAGGLTPILSGVKGLGGHTWAPDGSFLIYSVSEDESRDIEGVKRLQNLADRQPGWRSRSYLYRLRPADGFRQRLTEGDLTTELQAVSPDGKKLLVERTIINYAARPYSQAELSLLDLETLEASLLWKGSWLTGARWSPDGKTLLFLGGPSLFGEKGIKLKKGTVPNEYDIQAYLYDIETRQTEAVSKDFDPSVDSAFWSPDGRAIYFLTTDRAARHLYRLQVKERLFTHIPCGVDVIEQISCATRKPAAAFIGSSPNLPPQAYLLDLTSASVRLLKDPGREDYAGVKYGKVEPWTFRNRRGAVIDGLVYYPPDFDPAKKYPCIVNYYGGTTPVTSQFGGRYPKELYAAQGYVVYVLQPSGAIGYGQDFSALHVNDWGTIVADEIIDGVKRFLAEHAFVDAGRVGCIGASYGGFMTELLLTRTTIFAAAVSHAGISSIAGYWGEGFWGYEYSAVATAFSFPWNRPDIYVNQSPLFNAQKITTPLLLLHGAADTNVPPGESAQLFTALKLLGREVEFIQVLDQDHLILTTNKRIVWLKTILAWFDKWLKGQAEWWNDLYPKK
jgi:dipeptidyl aminopeptidase/acylaminoacyl peptidase